MRAQFLGTAAAEGYPDPFCDCENCRVAQDLGGPNLRKRSALLIDGKLLIDLGPDVLASAQMHNISLVDLQYCVQTHEHQDHLHPALFLARSQYCGVRNAPTLQYRSTQGAFDRALGDFGRFATLDRDDLCARLNLTFEALAPFRPIELGPYRVTPLAAAHGEGIVPLLYLIERDGRSLLYATDTGPLPGATRAALRAWGGRLDAVIMDHTLGYGAGSAGHLNGEDFRREIAGLRDDGLLAEGARVYATHIAHHSNPPHDALVAHAAAHGYLVAHDGLTITI